MTKLQDFFIVGYYWTQYNPIISGISSLLLSVWDSIYPDLVKYKLFYVVILLDSIYPDRVQHRVFNYKVFFDAIYPDGVKYRVYIVEYFCSQCIPIVSHVGCLLWSILGLNISQPCLPFSVGLHLP